MQTHEYPIDGLPCADRLKVSEHIVVVGCTQSGKLNVYRRNDKESEKMRLLTTLEESFSESARTEEIVILEQRGFFVDQCYILVTQIHNNQQKLLMHEVLIDELAEQDSQEMVISYGDVKTKFETKMGVDYQRQRWNINGDGNELLLINKRGGFKDIYAYKLCGASQFANSRYMDCSSNSKAEDGSDKFTIYSDFTQADIQVACSDI